MEGLKDLIIGQVWENGLPSTDGAILTNARHKNALDGTARALLEARESVVSDLSPEFAALHLREALQSIKSITGKTTEDEVLVEIFSKFCIGK
jgi:tRNA modification GTPase